jgi:hypothetical protein
MEQRLIEEASISSKDERLEKALNSARPMLYLNKVVAQYEMSAGPKVTMSLDSTPSLSPRKGITSTNTSSPSKR